MEGAPLIDRSIQLPWDGNMKAQLLLLWVSVAGGCAFHEQAANKPWSRPVPDERAFFYPRSSDESDRLYRTPEQLQNAPRFAPRTFGR